MAAGLGLTPKHLQQLADAFDRMDVGATGYVAYPELLLAMRERERSHYTDLVFDVMDLNRDKLIDFDELVVRAAFFFSLFQTPLCISARPQVSLLPNHTPSLPTLYLPAPCWDTSTRYAISTRCCH